MMRSSNLAVTVLAALAGALVFAATSSAKTVFFVKKGHGWGHGIGMSQYGAQGLALNGKTWQQIIAHYYPDTGLWQRPANSTVKVILATGSRLHVGSSGAGFKVNGTLLPAGIYTAKRSGAKVAFIKDGQTRKFASPATLVRTTGSLRLGSTDYRGKLILSTVSGGLRVTNRLGLESYLYGVVPREALGGWDADAYGAQAVAARSYAIASGLTVSATTSSQVYGGKSAETPPTNAAVDATARQVVVYPEGSQNVLQTFFFSTSGGKTCSFADCGWGGSPAYSYPSVNDPYDSISPLHNWGPIRFTGRQARARLGSHAPSGLRDMRVTINSSSRVASVALIGATTNTISGGTFRALFSGGGLPFSRQVKSTWFRVGVLGLRPSSTHIAAPKKVRLFGFAKKMGTTLTVQQRLVNEAWQNAGQVGVSNNRFEIVTRPRQTTYYRVRSGDRVGPTVVVRVG